MCKVIIFTLRFCKSKDPSRLGLLWYTGTIPWRWGKEKKPHTAVPTGCQAPCLSCWARALGVVSEVSCLFIILFSEYQNLSAASVILKDAASRDLWRFSLNLQNKSAHWIYCMSRFIYIHPKGADIKNELHKKIIFRDNSRPYSPVIAS